MAVKARYRNCLHRLRRAGVFAGAATDAQSLIHLGQPEIVAVRNGIRRLGGAMFRTGRAIRPLGLDDASLQVQLRAANPGELLVSQVEQGNGPIRTNSAAFVASEVAKGMPVIQARFHQARQAIFEKGRPQNMRRTGAHAKLAGRAVAQKPSHPAGTCARDDPPEHPLGALSLRVSEPKPAPHGGRQGRAGL